MGSGVGVEISEAPRSCSDGCGEYDYYGRSIW